MTSLQIAINLFAYFVFTAGPFFVWFSRYNVPALTSIPFVVTAYLLPIWVVPFGDLYGQESVRLLTTINGVGSVAMLIGLVTGSRTRFSLRVVNSCLPVISSDATLRRVSTNIRRVLLFGILGMLVCFVWTGVVPMFADDPFLAKFFKGPYKEKYDQIATLYRFSQFGLISLLPLGVAIALERHDKALGALVLGAMAVLAVSLTRAPVLEGLILYLTVLATRSNKHTLQLLFGTILIYLAGSAIYIVLGLVQGSESLAENLSFGAPDIIDHLSFLAGFDLSKDMTYGLTFIGGLIPGNFKYNPAVYSLAISNPVADIAEISSGGFRMPPSIWGYASFAWPGVVLVPFLSGLVVGGAASLLKRRMRKIGTVNKVLMVMWFQIVVGFAASFFSMFYFGIISIAIFMLVTRKRLRRQHAVQ